MLGSSEESVQLGLCGLGDLALIVGRCRFNRLTHLSEEELVGREGLWLAQLHGHALL